MAEDERANPGTGETGQAAPEAADDEAFDPAAWVPELEFDEPGTCGLILEKDLPPVPESARRPLVGGESRGLFDSDDDE